MNKVFVFLVLSLLFLNQMSLFAQQSSKKKKEPVMVITEDKVKRDIKSIYKNVLKSEENKELMTFPFLPNASKVNEYAKHPNVEEETRIYRKWYKKLYKLLIIMNGSIRDYDLACRNKNKEEAQEAITKFYQAFDLFKVTIKKPDKISKEDWKKLKKKKKRKNRRNR